MLFVSKAEDLSGRADDMRDAAIEEFIEERRQQALAMIAKRRGPQSSPPPSASFPPAAPPILPAATLPVARSLCVHFTTLDGATLSARATFRTLSPAAIRATAHSRRSIDRGLTIAAGLQPGQQLESETRRFGNPQPIQTSLIPL